MPRENVEVTSTSTEPCKKGSWLPFIVFIISMAALVGYGIYYVENRQGNFGGYINQKPTEFLNRTCISTNVWYNGEIVYSWYDPIDSILAHPDLKQQRRTQGKSILKILRK